MSRTDQHAMASRAAAYVRMSTDHQQYSTSNQLEAIRRFAAERNWEIVREYSDAGKSGLTLRGRGALSELIRDVLAKKVDFSHILVYDVSRWGRFQNPDEAAHYEFICRQAGVAVHYCAEPFENDGHLESTVAKNFKRVMAAEYSRELSVKTFQGSCRLLQLGYKQGGPAPYGLRRMLVDRNGRHKMILKNGEEKNLHTDRVVYVPGPEAETQVVRWIFESFVVARRGATEIARQLSARSVPLAGGREWNGDLVRALLQNENYIGNLIYCRCSTKLRGRRIRNPRDKWIRKENAFPAVLPRELFLKAQDIFAANQKRLNYTDEELLEKMRGWLCEYGHLNYQLIKKLKPFPGPRVFQSRFGGLPAAYQLVGFQPRQDFGFFEVGRRVCKLNDGLIDEIQRQLASLGATAAWNGWSRVLHINQELQVGVCFARHSTTPMGTSRWILRWDASRWEEQGPPDLMLVVRLDTRNEGILDYYLFPGIHCIKNGVRLAKENGIYLDAYRFQSLKFLVGMAARVKIS